MTIPQTLAPLINYLESLDSPADLSQLEQLLSEVEVTREELEPFCNFKEDTYARNVIGESQHYELLLVCWRSGQASSIHDHVGSACSFKIVQGAAVETNFELTTEGKVIPNRTKEFKQGDICSAPDDGYIHQMLNAQSEGEELITFHIYSPPLRMNTYELDTSVPIGSAYQERYLGT